MSRRPRVKVAANLTKRAKKNDQNVKISQELDDAKEESVKLVEEVQQSNALPESIEQTIDAKENATEVPGPTPMPSPKPAETMQSPEYKMETPVPKHLFESPMKKIDHSHRIPNKNLSFIQNARIRTESLSSNKSVILHNTKKKTHYRSEEVQRIVEAKKDFKKRFSQPNPDKNSLTMYDMIYYNPKTNPLNHAGKAVKTKVENVEGGNEDVITTEEKKDSNNLSLVPQIKLGLNGEIILDETSLVVDNVKEQEALNSVKKFAVVYDDEISGNTGYYKRQKRTRDWPPHETIKFYRCLHTVGTDFSLMLSLFPNRTRRDLKLKFKKEEKNNLALINKALMHPKEFNVDELSKEILSEPEQEPEVPVNLKERRAKRSKELMKHKQDIPRKQLSRSIRTLTDGDFIYENEDVMQKRKYKRMRIDSEDSDQPVTNDATKVENKEQRAIIETVQFPVTEPETSTNIPEQTNLVVIEEIAEVKATPINDDVPSVDCDKTTDFINLTKVEEPVQSDDTNLVDEDLTKISKLLTLLNDIDISSLVLVESQDPENPSQTLNEIYTMCPQTKKLSANPLDLPADVIDAIKIYIAADP